MLLHLVSCLHRCTGDARSRKHQYHHPLYLTILNGNIKILFRVRYFVCLHYINIVLRKSAPFLNVCFLKILKNFCHATIKPASEKSLGHHVDSWQNYVNRDLMLSYPPLIFCNKNLAKYIYIYIYILLLWRYNSDTVLAFPTTPFHLRRSCTCSAHFMRFIFFKSFPTSSSHRDLGFPAGLPMNGFLLCILFTMFISGILFMCPNQLNLWSLT